MSCLSTGNEAKNQESILKINQQPPKQPYTCTNWTVPFLLIGVTVLFENVHLPARNDTSGFFVEVSKGTQKSPYISLPCGVCRQSK